MESDEKEYIEQSMKLEERNTMLQNGFAMIADQLEK